VELTFRDVLTPSVLLVPGHGEPGAGDGVEESCKGLKMVMGVASGSEPFVDGEEMFVEHFVLGGGVTGGVVRADAELAVAGDVEGLTLWIAAFVDPTPCEAN